MQIPIVQTTKETMKNPTASHGRRKHQNGHESSTKEKMPSKPEKRNKKSTAELTSIQKNNIAERRTITSTVAPKKTKTTRNSIKMVSRRNMPIGPTVERKKRYTKASVGQVTITPGEQKWARSYIARISLKPNKEQPDNVEHDPQDRTPWALNKMAGNVKSESLLNRVKTNDRSTREPKPKADNPAHKKDANETNAALQQ